MNQPNYQFASNQEPITPIERWIGADKGYLSLRQPFKNTLQAVLTHCPEVRPDGSYVGCDCGGTVLSETAEVSLRTLWRHIERLEAMGFIVTLRSGGRYDGRDLPNMYGVPGFRGALDRKKQSRAMQRMIRQPGGIYKPQRVAKGEQSTLWTPDAPAPKSTQPTGTASPREHHQEGANRTPQTPKSHSIAPRSVSVPRDKMSRPLVTKCHAPPCQNVTDHGNGVLKESNYKNHGARESVSSNRRARFSRLERSDLKQADTLLTLFNTAVSKGWIGGSDRDRLNFVALAMHALRCAETPGAMFVANLKNKRFNRIAQEDEDAAQALIKAALFPKTKSRRSNTKRNGGLDDEFFS